MSGPDQDQGGELSPEAVTLAALASNSAGLDAELSGGADPATGAPAPDQAPAPDVGAEVAGLLEMGVAMLSPVAPFLPKCYTPAACQRIGAAFAAVAEKRGWNVSEVMSPELALCIVALPPTIQAVMMARAHYAPKLPKPDQDKPDQVAAKPQPLELAPNPDESDDGRVRQW